MRSSYRYQYDLRFEKLERRDLFAVSVEWNKLGDGLLDVTSDAAADSIWVYGNDVGGVTYAMVDAIVNNQRTNIWSGVPAKNNVPAANVEQLIVEGGIENDTIDVIGVDSENTWKGLQLDIKLYGGDGNDSIVGSALRDHIQGDDGNDILKGGDDDDVIWGLVGNDMIYGQGGGDLQLYGGTGNDTIVGGDGSDNIYGEGGADSIAGDNASTLVSASWGDTIYGDGIFNSENAGADTIDGEVGDDTIYGGQGDDKLYGGKRTDSFGGGDDVIVGDEGNDTICGDTGLYGASVASGNDTINGGNDHDSILGGDLRDDLYGDSGYDTLSGEGGDDFLDGGSEDDLIHGGANADTLWGQGGCDDLRGDAGKDSISGGDQDDTGDGGADNLATDNLMDGGAGRDVMTPEEPFDDDISDPCAPGFTGPEMLEGAPVLVAEQTVGYRDQRFALRFLSTLSIEDVNSLLRYYGMNEEERSIVRRWRDMFLAGDLETLLGLVTSERDCGCGDWSM